jgi:uncharacterized membrane protein YesL
VIEGLVRFLKLFLRGLKDAYDQFVLLMIVSVLWWVCAVLIVPGPPATVALLRMMDPRNAIQMPEIADFFRTLRQHFRSAWIVALFTVPVIVVLTWNMLFFRDSDSIFAIMVPLWFVMIVITFMLMLFAFATIAAMESSPRNAFRGAVYLLVMWPFTSALLFVLLTLLSGVFAVLVLPLILFGPGVAAAVVNRFVLAGYDVEVIDPSAPTSEREHEVARGINPEHSGIKGLFQRSRDNRKREARR